MQHRWYQFRYWLTAWSVKAAKRQDENEKNWCACATGSTRELKEEAHGLDQDVFSAD
jgi:hypothetical protein